MPPWSTLPQAPLRSRTGGFPQAGADLGLPAVALPSRAQLQRCPPDTPLRDGLLPRALPGAPAPPVRGLLARPRASRPGARARRARTRRGRSAHVTRRDPAGIACPGAGARPSPSSWLGPPLTPRSGPVAGSPCGEQALPDVLAASRSRRAGPPPPAAREAPGPVASLPTAAFPSCGPGRRSAMDRPAPSGRRAGRGCSHALLCRPAGGLAPPLAPPATASTVGPP